MTLRLDALADERGPVARAAPHVALMLNERLPAVRLALDATLRVLYLRAVEQVVSPFGAASWLEAVCTGPFDPDLDLFEVDSDGLVRVVGGTLTDGSYWAVRTYGVEPLVGLATAVSVATGIADTSAARLPALGVPWLLAACAAEVREQGMDAVRLAAALISNCPFAPPDAPTRRILAAAGLSTDP